MSFGHVARVCRRGDARREGRDDQTRLHQAVAQRHGHRFDRPACEEAGADGICLINTLLGMRIDVRNRKAVIANTMGGFSGAAVFPVAVRMVYQVAKACKIPVMGCGGVTTAAT